MYACVRNAGWPGVPARQRRRESRWGGNRMLLLRLQARRLGLGLGRCLAAACFIVGFCTAAGARPTTTLLCWSGGARTCVRPRVRVRSLRRVYARTSTAATQGLCLCLSISLILGRCWARSGRLHGFRPCVCRYRRPRRPKVHEEHEHQTRGHGAGLHPRGGLSHLG